MGLCIHVSHFPPGTSKWHKIEHRLFCHITQNWRGRPLRTFETLVALIGHTRTAAGLRVRAKLDKRRYKTGLVVPLAEMRRLALHPHPFHGDCHRRTAVRHEVRFDEAGGGIVPVSEGAHRDGAPQASRRLGTPATAPRGGPRSREQAVDRRGTRGQYVLTHVHVEAQVSVTFERREQDGEQCLQALPADPV